MCSILPVVALAVPTRHPWTASSLLLAGFPRPWEALLSLPSRVLSLLGFINSEVGSFSPFDCEMIVVAHVTLKSRTDPSLLFLLTVSCIDELQNQNEELSLNKVCEPSLSKFQKKKKYFFS